MQASGSASRICKEADVSVIRIAEIAKGVGREKFFASEAPEGDCTISLGFETDDVGVT